MAKTNKKSPKVSKNLLYSLGAVIAVLVLLCATTATIAIRENRKNNEQAINVNLGVFGYNFNGGRAVKRTDSATMQLRSFLTASAHKDIQLGCTSPFYSVVAYSSDEAQVFLRYGCNAPTSPMYAVKTNGNWHFISPTNHFDIFGIPDCAYLAQNNIAKNIAPVCVNNISDSTPQYTAR